MLDPISEFVVQVDNFSVRDIRQLVHIHRAEIHLGFLTSLGDKALGLLFSLAVESRHSLLLTVKDTIHDQQVGFLLGTLDTGAFYKDFFRKKMFNAFLILLPKLFSLSTVRKLIEVLLYPSKKDIQKFPKAELLDIAVSSQCQGKGLAKQLFKGFCSQLKKRNMNEFKITTGEKLKIAQNFYETLGAVKTATTEVHKGQKTFVYIYKICE